MYSRTPEFAARAKPSDRPLVLFGLSTPGGLRIMADFTPSPAMVGFGNRVLADGQHQADGAKEAGQGSDPVLAEKKALIRSSALTESLTPRSGELLGALRQVRESGLRMVLENGLDADGKRFLSKLLSNEGLLGGRAQLALTYPGLSPDAALVRFWGRVSGFTINRQQATLTLKAL